MYLPEKDRYTYGRIKLIDQLTSMMGGRIAEEMIFNDITSGAYGDIRSATRLARKMVCEWGMSEKLGFIEYGEKEEPIFVGRDNPGVRDFSETTAVAIDTEVRRIIDECYARAKKILEDNKDKLIALAKGLLEFETLDGDHVDEIIKHGKLMNPPAKIPPPAPPTDQPTMAPGLVDPRPSSEGIGPTSGPLPSPA